MSDTIAAVLTREPIWNGVPAGMHRLLQSCLEKDPKRRLRDIGDVWRLLEEPAPSGRITRLWPGIAACAVLFAVVASWGWRASQTQELPLQPLTRLDLDLGPTVFVGSINGPTAILSPDAKRFVFVARDAEARRALYTRPSDKPTAVRLSGTEGAYSPFFSADGQRVGFFTTEGKLKTTRVDGGQPSVLCDAPAGRGAVWLEDGSIVAALDTRVGLSRIAPDGRVSPLTHLEPGEVTHRWPQALPGDRAVIFTVSSSPTQYSEAGISAVALKDPLPRKTVLPNAGMSPHYLSIGQLVYVRNATVYAINFDVDSLQTSGTPTAVLEGIAVDTTSGMAQVVFARNGAILYQEGPTASREFTLQWLDQSGKTKPLWAEAGPYLIPRLAPDGSNRFAVALQQGSISDIWVFDWENGRRTRLTGSDAQATYPVWTPDAKYVLYQVGSSIHWSRSDGDIRGTLTTGRNAQTPSSFTPDGKTLAFFESKPEGAVINVVGIDYTPEGPKAGMPTEFLQTRASNPYLAFSRDGQWIAYASTDDGFYKLYVRAYPDKGRKWPVSTGWGIHPVWSPTRNELYYRDDDGRIMEVAYQVKAGEFVPGTPRPFTDFRFWTTGMTPNFDIALTGDRFAVMMPPESLPQLANRSHVTLVLNFFDEVRRRMAGAR